MDQILKPKQLAVVIICITWLWQILSLMYPQEPALNFFLPKVSLLDNMPLAALITLGKGIGYLLMVLWLLRHSHERLSDIGFHREHLLRTVSIGAAFGVAIFIFNSALLLPIIEKLFPKLHVNNSALFGSAINILILFFLGIVKGGFLEELWRIFVLSRFEALFNRTGLIAALIVSSIFFGLGHAYQGSSAIIGTGILGLLNGLVYLRKRSAFEAVTAHAIFDILSVTGGALLGASHS